MKNCILIFIGCILFGCSSETKKLADIYFYNVDDLSTIVPIKCNEMENYNNLVKIDISDENLYDRLKEITNSKILKQDSLSDRNIDIRYRVCVNKDTLCINEEGEFLLNGNYQGKLEIFKELIVYIKNNKSTASKITDDIRDEFKIEE